MARKRGQKALYEVMSKARAKPGFGRTLEKMRPKKPAEKKDEPVKNENAVENAVASKVAVKWLKKPRLIQFNVGRIEFSLPYQLVIALLLGFILLVLAAYRLGQLYSVPKYSSIDKPTNEMRNRSIGREKPIQQNVGDVKEPPAPVEDSTVLKTEEDAEPVERQSTGNNVIVLVQFDTRADLLPVQQHFAEHDIATEIIMENGRYYLQTKDRYDNPGIPGTDGYKARQKIVEVGAKYKGKAPPGYETFAPNFFSDAYGKKVK
jgi:hypothetical protein